MLRSKILNFHRCFIYFASFVAIFNILSCAFKKHPHQDEKEHGLDINLEKDRANNNEYLNRGFKVEFIPIDKFAQSDYKIQISWVRRPGTIAEFRFKSEISNPLSSSMETKSVDMGQVDSFTQFCPSGFPIEVEIFQNLIDNEINNKELKLEKQQKPLKISKRCPTDYTVKGDVKLSNLPRLIDGRLFFENKSVLEVDNQSIVLKELQGLIINGDARLLVKSRDNNNAVVIDDLNQNPIVLIKTRLAKGVLQVDLVGQDGKDGTSGYIKQQSEDYKKLLEDNKPKVGEAGDISVYGVFNRKKSKNGNGEITESKCLSNPTNGHDGEQGKIAGLDGDPGQNGGSTFPVSFLADEVDRDFQLHIFISPGEPGRGGEGGSGQSGAVGGPPGLNPQNQCPKNAEQGKPGKSAPDGSKGADGKPGSCGQLVLPKSISDRIHVKALGAFGDRCYEKSDFIRWQ